MRRILFILALFLAGCQTTGSSTIGSGPITLSPRIQAAFDKFNKSHGSTFAVAIDGSSSYYYFYCSEVKCYDHVGERQLAIEGCEKSSNGVPCKIYALLDGVVWDFDGGTNSAAADLDGDFRKMEIDWEGQGQLTTTIDLNNKEAKLALSNGVVCDGDSQSTGNGSTGTWVIVCSDGMSAEGTYSVLGRDKGAIGKGVDHFGKEVRYTIFSKGAS